MLIYAGFIRSKCHSSGDRGVVVRRASPEFRNFHKKCCSQRVLQGLLAMIVVVLQARLVFAI